MHTAVVAETYKLSMLPRYSPEEIHNRIKPLADYLATVLNAPVEVIITTDFDSYIKKLNSGEIAIGYENPYVYTQISEHHEAVAITVKSQEGAKFRGIVITRADSPITKLTQLRGKTISIVSLTSAGGYLSQNISLKELGIDLKKDSVLIEAADNKQENVIFNVYHGDADAGFIRESAKEMIKEYVPKQQMRIIAATAWLPNWALSVRRDLPQSVKTDIQNAVLGLKSYEKAISALKIDAFQKADDSDYDILREKPSENPEEPDKE